MSAASNASYELPSNEYEGLHRASACHSIKNSDMIPEIIQLVPEVSDNSITYGATQIDVGMTVTDDLDKMNVLFRDNGRGFGERGEARFFQWASAADANMGSRYGHGLRGFLAKAEPDYNSCTWSIGTRTPESVRSVVYCSPYRGKWTKSNRGPDDYLEPHGTEIRVVMRTGLLRTDKASYETTDALAALLKEIFRTRYSEAILRRVRFLFTLKGRDGKVVTMDSHEPGKEWHSLEHTLQEAVRQGFAFLVLPETHRNFDSEGRVQLRHICYGIRGGGGGKKKVVDYGPLEDFPLFGRRAMSASLIHTFNGDRMIEACSIPEILGVPRHNRFNGLIAFAQFIPRSEKEDFHLLPRPATIKVAFLNTTPEWQAWLKMCREIWSGLKIGSDGVEGGEVPAEGPGVVPPVEPPVGPPIYRWYEHLDPALTRHYERQIHTFGVEAVKPFDVAPYLDLPLGVVTVNEGFHTILMHRQKMKDLRADFFRCHAALAEYATKEGLAPTDLQMLILLSITNERKKKERLDELRALKAEVATMGYYPLASRIDFGLEDTDSDAAAAAAAAE